MRGNTEKQKGSALLITTLLLMIVIIMLGTCFSISGVHYETALIEKYSSNTYYIARAGVEKHLQIVEQAVESELPKMMEEIKLRAVEAELVYEEGKIQIPQLKEQIMERIYDFIQEAFVNQPISYRVQGEVMDKSYSTQVIVDIKDRDSNNVSLKLKNQFRVVATLKTESTNISLSAFDKKTVEAVMEIEVPDEISHAIKESYDYYEGETAEVMNQALLCFSDLVITESGEMRVEKGEVKVKGSRNICKLAEESLEEKIERNGGVIVGAGGSLLVRDGLYCMESLSAVNGESLGGRIQIEGEVVAKSLSIGTESLKQKVKNKNIESRIEIGQNAMIDQQVLISSEADYGTIDIERNLFVLNKGDPKDDFVAGGIFAAGNDANITAEHMYIMNQPNLLMEETKDLESGKSIYSATNTTEGLQTSLQKEQIIEGSGFEQLEMVMNGRRIQTDIEDSYGLASVVIEEQDMQRAKISSCMQAVFGADLLEAEKFFYRGNSAYSFLETAWVKDIEEAERAMQIQGIIENLASYYKGNEIGSRRKLVKGNAGEAFEGLKGYMTIKRGVFYKTLEEGKAEYMQLKDLINLERLPCTLSGSQQNSWSYETPICITNGGEIDISKFYVTGKDSKSNPYPSIIINFNGKSNQTTNKLVLSASEKSENTFKGIIISEGTVEIAEDLNIEGVMIIGGPEAEVSMNSALVQSNINSGEYAGLKITGGTVTLDYSPQVLLKVDASQTAVYRAVLDALHLTNYSAGSSVEGIIKTDDFYTKQPLCFTDKAILSVDTQNIKLKIKSLKQVD